MTLQSRTISASQVKNNFGTIVNQVYKGVYPEIIVENRGEPVVAIVHVKELKVMKAYKEQERRKEALAMLRNAREKVQARLKGKLTDRQAQVLADRFSRELVNDLAKEGKIKFERKTPKHSSV